MDPAEQNTENIASSYAWLLAGDQNNPLYIQQSLMLAAQLRLDFHLDFSVSKHVVYQYRGLCEQFDANGLKIWLRGEVERMPSVGMEVHAYFSLCIERKTLPCDFTAKVISTSPEGSEKYIVISLPADMGHNQRRHNVRVAVGKGDISNFRLWYGKTVGTHQVEWMPFADNQIDVLDISAGGMHLAVGIASPLLPQLARQELLLVNGEFEIKGRDNPPLAMVGPIVRLLREEDTRARLGMQFRRWAKVRKGDLRWLTLGEQEGIAPLGSWVFQNILTRYKKSHYEFSFPPKAE